MARTTREKAIADLRAKLASMVDEDHSICDVAAREGVFCGGFARWSFHELRSRFPQITRGRPRVTPKELRELANTWQVVRRDLTGDPVVCDTMLGEKGQRLCRGWDEFSDEDLARFHMQLCGEEIEIVPAAEG